MRLMSVRRPMPSFEPANSGFSVRWCRRPDGRILLRSDGLSNIVLENAAKLGCLPVTRLPELMSACLAPAQLCREDQPARDLERFRIDLIEILAMIDAALSTLRTARP
jgi:hypothetical protein